jgi:1,4-dihydroxy-6-naphthoate synthase
MKISLGYSPCPNDTFIFDALAHGKVDTEGLEFDIRLADVEALNRWAFAGELDVTKLSYHAFAHLRGSYALLDAGSALGRNCGPLLIARRPLSEAGLADARVVIPGRYTTANFLLSLAYPQLRHKEELVFSAIEDEVLSGRADAGLIIHENRFTYAQKGLIKIADLGEWWEGSTGYPIPLGGIVVKRSLPAEVQQRIERVLARSVAFALDNPQEAAPYVRAHAQEMDEEVMYAHIELYVNDFTRTLGAEGRSAIAYMMRRAEELGVIAPASAPLFVSD